jgi:hypothetical protein
MTIENQMKVCFISQAQFNEIWNRSTPSQRSSGDLTTQSFMARQWNTLFIVGKAEDFLAEPGDVIPEKYRL